MVAIKKGVKKSYLQKKLIKRQRWSKKNVAKPRKLPSQQKKNAGALKVRKNSSLRMCPLVSLILKNSSRDKVLSSRKQKCTKNFCSGYHFKKASAQVGKQKKTQRVNCGCSTSLQALLREMASKKRSKWVAAAPKRTKLAVAATKRTKWAVAAPKRRIRFSDDEIFYRLANVKEEEDGSEVDAETDASSDLVPGPEILSQPAANEPQAVTTN